MPPDQVLDGALRSLADMYGGWLFLFLLEPILLAAWGYTPGKWIMGLRVRREDGRKLTWEEAGDRLVGVFFRGTGLGIPIYNIARLWDCYEKCAKDQVMSWDQGLSYTARPMKWGRGGSPGGVLPSGHGRRISGDRPELSSPLSHGAADRRAGSGEL